LRKLLLVGKIWFHTPSVGEFNTAKPLIEFVKNNKKHTVVLSYSSPRAEEFFKKQNSVDKIYKLFPPLGFKVKNFLKKEKPDTFILVESDRYPALLTAKVERKFIVNARISKKSFRLLKLFKFFYAKWFNTFEKILCKDEEDCKRFHLLGVKSSILHLCGNLKAVSKLGEVKKVIKFPTEKFIIVLGSTHEGEEEIWLNAFKKIRQKIPYAVLVIAPRHIGRANKVCKLAKEKFPNLIIKRRTEITDTFDGDILIVDTLGELLGFYKTANICFVGGSLVKVGGHNLLEPAFFSKPTLYGPYIFKFKDLERILENLGLAYKVKNEIDIVQTVINIFKKPPKILKNFENLSMEIFNCYIQNISI